MASTTGGPAGQRSYSAACPNCGAPVSFASAASASAVCSFCRSTLVRDGEALRRIGVSAELFEDHSPLQLGVTGLRQGVTFTLVGRLQYAYVASPSTPAELASTPVGSPPKGEARSSRDGTWNEWHALFDNGRSAWLSEDNGAYVLAFDAPLPADAPPIDELRAGERVRADGRYWDVASVVEARLLAAQGELPAPPRLEGSFRVVDLRNAQGEVGTLDASDPRAVHWSTGQSIALSELRLQGLRDTAAASEKTLASRAIECPSCGAALAPKLSSTQSISCEQCRAVVDLSGGVGGDLKHYAQNNSGEGGLEPQIPLGRTGRLALDSAEPLPWTVVGYLERCDIPESGDDEQTFWREYLLYNQREGFAFLVDAEDGWSWVKPMTGAPELKNDTARWMGRRFRRTWRYAAKVTWVQGEFYWRVQRDERALVMDFEAVDAGSPQKLSREQGGNEVTWSAGDALQADTIGEAFSLTPSERGALQRDVSPVSSASSFEDLGKAWSRLKTIFLIIFVIIVVVSLLAECSDDRCDTVRQTFGADSPELRQCLAQNSSRTSGGSWGGYSSGGGGHK